MEDTTTAVLEPQVEIEELLSPEPVKEPGIIRRLVIDSFKSIAATLIIFIFLVTYVVQGFRVYGSCMEPNLVTGERLLGNKFIYRFVDPGRGDVVIFRYPKDPSKTYIKRIVALPGETVEIRSGKLLVNNRPLKEPYLVHTPHGSYGPEKIKPGCLFVLGDYRDCSNDSRYWGQLPIEDVTAKAWLKYWPVKKLQIVK